MQPWKTELPSFVPLRRSALNLMWGEEIVLSYFGNIWTAFVHAPVGSKISFGVLPMVAGLSPLVFQTIILDFHNSGPHPLMCNISFQIMCLLT